MPRNQARAPLLAKGFSTVPSMWPGTHGPGDLTETKQAKQTKQNKQNKQPSFMVGFLGHFLPFFIQIIFSLVQFGHQKAKKKAPGLKQPVVDT